MFSLPQVCLFPRQPAPFIPEGVQAGDRSASAAARHLWIDARQLIWREVAHVALRESIELLRVESAELGWLQACNLRGIQGLQHLLRQLGELLRC